MALFQRQATFRFELLDSSGKTIGDLAVDGSTRPTITHDTSRSINRTISSIILDRRITDDINPYSDKVRPIMDHDGRSHALGVFLFGSSSVVTTNMGRIRASAMVDQTFIVDQPVERSVSFPIGTRLTDAVAIVIAEVGEFEYTIVPNAAVVGSAPLAWGSDTSALQIINDLCSMLGYYPLHFNNSGIGQIRPAIDASAASPSLAYGTTENPILDQSLVESDILLEVPNRYIVVDTSSINTPIVGYYDVPPSLPHSFAKRGFYLREKIEVQGLESTLQANYIAAAIAQQDSRQGRASFNSPPDYRHDSYDLLWVDGKKYLEVAWSLPLVEGSEMQHTLVLVAG